MKKIYFLIVSFLLITIVSFAQKNEVKDKESKWPELTAFHELMAATFHPAEKGDLVPLKEKAPQLYRAVKMWHASVIPDSYNKKETAETLQLLLVKCNDIWAETVSENSSDKKLLAMIGEAHELFHNIVAVCKKKAE